MHIRRTITAAALIAAGLCALGATTAASAAPPEAGSPAPAAASTSEVCGATASAWEGITLRGTMHHDAWTGGATASSTFTFAPSGDRVQWDRTFNGSFLPPIDGVRQYERFAETGFHVQDNTVVWDQPLSGTRPAQVRLTALSCSSGGRVLAAKGEAFFPAIFNGVYGEGTLPGAPLRW